MTLPGVPAFFQGMLDFTSVSSHTATDNQLPLFLAAEQNLNTFVFYVPIQPPASGSAEPAPPQQSSAPPPQASGGAGGDSLNPELFTGIVQGVLSTMMSSLGAQQGNGESIAQFIQRLSQTSNLFTPGSGDAVGQSEHRDDCS